MLFWQLQLSAGEVSVVANDTAFDSPIHASGYAPSIEASAIFECLTQTVPWCSVRSEVCKFDAAVSVSGEFVRHD